MLEGYTWYTKEQAKRFAPILSCYPLRLRDTEGNIFRGYYYCGKFYCSQIDVTDKVLEWMIPQKGESVTLN